MAVSAFRPYLDQARELGAVAVLEKPYEAKQLATLVHDLAGGRAPELADLVLVWASRACEQDEPVTLAGLAVAPERLEPTIEQLRSIALGGQIGRLGRSRFGVIVPGKTAEQALEDLKRVVGEDAPITAVDLACYVGATGLALRHVERKLGKAGLVDAPDSDEPPA